MRDGWKKITELKEGDIFHLRGGKKTYTFIAFCGGGNGDLLHLRRGIAFMKDENGKERHQKMLPFTLVKYPINTLIKKK
jgi:hypothetical protein